MKRAINRAVALFLILLIFIGTFMLLRGEV